MTTLPTGCTLQLASSWRAARALFPLLCFLPLLTGCLHYAPHIEAPVEGDSFMFCPDEDKVAARNFMGFGNALTMSEEEFTRILWLRGIYYKEANWAVAEICDDDFGSEIQTIYEVYRYPPDRFPGGRFVTNYYVTIDQDGMVRHIQSQLIFSTH